MADITKCQGQDCPLKNDCYRFTAESNGFRQSYFVKVPVVIEEKMGAFCDYFYPVEN